MTKHYPNDYRKEMDKDIPIAISGKKVTKPDKPRYLCSECRFPLVKISDDEYYCNTDHLSFYPNEDNMRTASRVSMPRTAEENPPLVSTAVPDPTKEFLNKGKVEPHGAFKALQDRGIKITNYTETDGAGRTIKKSRWT